MTENPWIEWNGGECPVEPDAVVEVKVVNRRTLARINGEPFCVVRAAKLFDWRRDVDPRWCGNIKAYRVVKP